MEPTERIQGERRIGIIEQLQRDRTLLRMRLEEEGYEALTILTGCCFQGKNPFLLIEESDRLKEVLRDLKDCHIEFEFNGKDNLRYSFKALFDRVSGDEIRIGFPECIERIQRRRHFRIDLPVGSELHFERDSKRCVMNVINISLGGAFGGILGPKKGAKDVPIVKKGECLKDILIFFRYEKEDWRVFIEETTAKRVSKDPHGNRYLYALQFTKIQRQESSVLKKIIYDLQRIILRKRLPL